MTKKFTILIFCFFSGITGHLYSQAKHADRVEISFADAKNGYSLIAADTNGLLVFYEKDERSKDGKREWVFTLYDQDLEEVRTKSKLMDKNISESIHYFDKKNNILYLLLSSTGPKMQYTLLTYDFNTNKISTKSNEVPLNFTFTGFVVNDDGAYLGGYKLHSKTGACLLQCIYSLACGIPYLFGASPGKYDPIVVKINKETGDFKLVTLNYPKSALVNSLTVNEFTGKTEIVVSNYVGRESDLYLRVLGEKDKSQREIMIDPQAMHTLMNASSTNLSSNERIIVGMYSNPGKGKTTNAAFTGTPRGFYVTRYDGQKQEYMRYYPFSKFDYFKDLVAKSKKKKKRDPYTGYMFAFHNIEKKDSSFIVIADAYEPVYEYRTYYDGKTWRTERVLVGYQFTKSMVASFDEDGNMNWNSVFDIWSPLTWNLSPKTRVSKSVDGSLVIVYSNGGYIKSKVINDDGLQEGQKSVKLATDHKNDKVVGYSGDIQPWYADYYIAYGYQRIKNTKNEADKKRRTVFYMNKVEVNE